ncbi:MAG: RNB domain-containing ribonuclease [Myxococcales bacterium]|nr:RNB domain-containing ribonuclease [Myxococcales bacterium]
MSTDEPAPTVARLVRARGESHAQPLRGAGEPRRVRAGAQGLSEGTIVMIDARGHVIERLAEPNSARAALYEIVADHDIDVAYPRAVQREVAAIASNPRLTEGTVDQTALPYVTIDNDSSRDLDQAIHIARGRGGEGYQVRYALADASYYVRPGSALLDDSLSRGTSYYLPGFSVPMLPRRLSEDLVSLNPEVTRRALVFCMHLDDDARCQRVEVERARIRSRGKLTYAGVQAYYDRPSESPLFARPFSASLELLREVGEKRIERAEERDVVVYERRELDVTLTDRRGTRFRARMRRRNDTERYNEQISLLCNTQGARLLLGGADAADDAVAATQPIFRVHRPPPRERVERLRETVDAIVEAQGLARETWCWHVERESAARYLARLPADGERQLRVRRAIEQQLRYVNQASRFERAPGPHHALGVEAYARFSSPMREVVGIITHKEALEQLGYARPGAETLDAELRDRAIEVANAAKKRQRAISKAAHRLAIDQFLGDDLARPFAGRAARPATVMGVRGSRLYVELDDFAIELKIYTRDIEAMTGRRYVARGLQLVPEGADNGDAPSYRVGDGVALRTRGRDAKRDRWQLWPEPLRGRR